MYTEEASRSQIDNKENPSPPMTKNLRNSNKKKKASGLGASTSENGPASVSGFANQTTTEKAASAQNSATKKTLFGDATAATNNFAVTGTNDGSSEPIDKMFAGLTEDADDEDNLDANELKVAREETKNSISTTCSDEEDRKEEETDSASRD